MEPLQIIAISGLVALVAAISYIRRRNVPNSKVIRAARERAQARANGERVDVQHQSCNVVVTEFDPHSNDLTPSQFAICELMEAGYRPEIKRDGYKYRGAPLTRVAGVPEYYNRND